MTNLARYVLPSRFIERYRPVRSHPHEKALGGHFFDPNAARFFIRMATVDPVPPEAVWTVLPPASDTGPFRVASGMRDQHALGHVICQVPFVAGEDLEFPLARQLTYRARLRITTLQGLLDDIRQAGQLAAGDAAAFIERRIEDLKV
jgi:hypothetical protein